MVIMYRNASYVRRRFWVRRFLLTSFWLLLNFEDRIQFVKFCKMIAAILAVLLLTPFAIFMHLALKVQKSAITTIIRIRHPQLTVANSTSVRCALDTRSDPGIVTTVLTLCGRVNVDDVRKQMDKDVLTKKVTTNSGREQLAFPTLKKVLEVKYGCYVWKEDVNFDVTNHVILAESKWRGQPVTEANIQTYISELCRRPITDCHPPWQMLLIHLHCSDTNNSQSVLVIRAHHLVSDGLSLTELLHARVLDPAWTPSLNRHKLMYASNSTTVRTLKKLMVNSVDIVRNVKQKCDPRVPIDDQCPVWLLVRWMVTFVRNVSYEMHKLYEKTDPSDGSVRSGWFRTIVFVYLMPRLLCRPDRMFVNISIVDLIKFVLILTLTSPFKLCKWIWVTSRNDLHHYAVLREICGEIGQTVTTMATAPSMLVSEMSRHVCSKCCVARKRFSRGGRKSVSWSEHIPMDMLQRIRETSGATSVNEVLLSLCTGSLKQYFRLNGIDVPASVLAALPIYSDGFFQARQAGAEGLVPLLLPTGELDPQRRLTAVRKVLRDTRSDCYKYIISACVLRHARSFLPDCVISFIVKYLTRNYSILLMNISLRSTAGKLSFGGHEINRICYLRPMQANLALSLSLTTYYNHVTLVAMSDDDVLPQPQVITDQFTKEFNSLALSLGVRRERHATPSSSPRITSNFRPLEIN